MATKKRTNKFASNDYVVYPTHGVGKISGIEEAEIAGLKAKFYVVSFEKDKMTLRVPLDKADNTGMRKLSSKDEMQQALTTLRGRARGEKLQNRIFLQR